MSCEEHLKCDGSTAIVDINDVSFDQVNIYIRVTNILL